MNLARVERSTSIVVNVESANQEWFDDHVDDPDYAFIISTDEKPAYVGGIYDTESEKFIPPTIEKGTGNE